MREELSLQGMSMDYAGIALYYFLPSKEERLLQERQEPYGWDWEEKETEELICFVRRARQEIERRKVVLSADIADIRITRQLRIFIGGVELKVRPMAKTVLILFLKHPEGIALKQIGNYEGELLLYYRRVMRSLEPNAARQRVKRILDLFNNDLNVNIARVNSAVSRLAGGNSEYRIQGNAGQLKTIRLDRSKVHWE